MFLKGFAVRLLTATLAITGWASATSVLAEEMVLEEVVVTATRRAETDIQTTPVAVSAITEDEFNNLFAQDIGEIALHVPNFSAATVTGFNAASFAMRGAAETDIIVYFDPKVGVIVDDFVVPHVQTQLLEPFDIESIEVLRGPQGTLFGKNTTSGAIVVRTKRPDLESSSLDASIQYGSFDDTKANVAFNIPLSDTMAFRFAGLYQKSDGYYENGKVDFPIDAFGAGLGDAGLTDGSAVRGDGSDLGGKDVFSGRAKLLIEPNDRLSILGQVEVIKDRSDPVPVINDTQAAAGQLATLLGFPGVTSGDPLDQAGIHSSQIVNLDDEQEVDVLGTYLNIEYSLENHTLYGLVGYREQESRLPNEYLGTSYESFFAATRDDDRETFQVEGRIASELDGNVNYVAGLFYQTNDVEFCVLQQLGLTEFFGSAVPGVLDNATPLLLCNRQDATAYAAFVDVTIDISEKFSLGLGVRHTNEEKDYIAREGLPVGFIFPGGMFSEPLDGQNFNLASFAVQRDDEEWSEPTWRITGSYQFTNDVFGYATVSRGFKSGGYNDQAGSGGFGNFPVNAYDPEFATSYEIGIKTTLAEERVRFNATYFNVNYEDFQRSTVVSVPGTVFQETRTFNAADVDAQGVEVELTALLAPNLTLRANIGWLDTEYQKFVLDRNLDGILEDFSGREVVRSPEITGGADLTYIHDLSSGANLVFNINYLYEDENTYYYNDDIGSQFDTVLEERSILGASVTWNSADDRYYVSAFGKNLTDDRYKTASQAVGALWTFSNYGPPRFYGVQAGFRMGG
ncbi:MAG: TonB-dependent receptor [Pseudomonadales bacterium]|nr:TonB-dependent receptor [Pseudomonadales bacterium]